MTSFAHLPSFLTGRQPQAPAQPTSVASRFPSLFGATQAPVARGAAAAGFGVDRAVFSARATAPVAKPGAAADFSPLPPNSRPADFSPLPPNPRPADFSPLPPNPRPADFSPLPPAGAPVPPPPPPPPPPPAPVPPPPAPVPPPPAPGATAPAPASAAAPVDGQAPDPAKLRAAILAYRNEILASDARNRGNYAMVFSNLGGGTNRVLALLPGLMVPHGANILSLAWLGREATPAELARYAELQKADPRGGTQAAMTEIVNRGMLARLRRTDGSPAAFEAIQRQVAQMLVWQPGDLLGHDDRTVPAIPPGPALDPMRAASSPTTAGTPNADRARSPQAHQALRAAIAEYEALVMKGSEMTMVFSGRLSGNQIFLLPGFMLPHGAKMMMLAWLGREPNADELARWQGWYKGEGGRDARTAFGDVMADIERTAMAALLPETDGTPAAVQALRAEMAARMTWK